MELEIINSVILLRETRGFQAQCLLRLNEKIDCQKIEHRHQWMLRGKWWAHSKLIQFYRAIEKWSKYVQFSLIRFIFTPYSWANIIFVWRYFFLPCPSGCASTNCCPLPDTLNIPSKCGGEIRVYCCLS